MKTQCHANAKTASMAVMLAAFSFMITPANASLDTNQFTVLGAGRPVDAVSAWICPTMPRVVQPGETVMNQVVLVSQTQSPAACARTCSLPVNPQK